MLCSVPCEKWFMKLYNSRYFIIGTTLISCQFGLAFIAKSLQFDQFQATILKSHLVPYPLVSGTALIIHIAEIVVCVGVWIPWCRRRAFEVAWLLSALFGSYNLWRAFRGIDAPCGCFGALFTMSPTAGFALNMTSMLVLALLMVTHSRQRAAIGSSPAESVGILSKA